MWERHATGKMPKSVKGTKQSKSNTPYNYEIWKPGLTVSAPAKRANDRRAVGGLRTYVSYTCPHGCGSTLFVADPARGLHTAVDDHRRVCSVLPRRERPPARGGIKYKTLAKRSDSQESAYQVLVEMYEELVERRHDDTYRPPPPPPTPTH